MCTVSSEDDQSILIKTLSCNQPVLFRTIYCAKENVYMVSPQSLQFTSENVYMVSPQSLQFTSENVYMVSPQSLQFTSENVYMVSPQSLQFTSLADFFQSQYLFLKR